LEQSFTAIGEGIQHIEIREKMPQLITTSSYAPLGHVITHSMPVMPANCQSSRKLVTRNAVAYLNGNSTEPLDTRGNGIR